MNSNYSLIFLLFFFISCYSTDKESNEEKKAVHNQLSSNVEMYENGNANANGTFIYTGFSPAYVLIKRIDATEQWAIYDNKKTPYNEAKARLAANSANAEDTSEDGIDMLSNGFKCRTTWGGINSSNNFLYMAFAESPFKTSNAR